ncbi:acyl-CoA/acyl-ACP dehydrogenase [Chloroflexi bacterium TSY]|nr:acyl-CoA/acyl-ACP dehydrogenase [Chloroflexi bacterium TSY]
MLYPQTEKQRKFVSLATELSVHWSKRAAKYDQAGSFPYENYAEARTAQLPSLIIPEEYGGWGASLLDSVMTIEALAIGDGSTALGLTMHIQTMGAVAENRNWPSELFAYICHEAVTKGALVNSVATEPELGSPSRGGLPKTTATPLYQSDSSQPTAWLLNGHKTWATMFPALDYMIIPAALQDNSNAVARFVVATDRADGGQIEIIDNFDVLGMRATASHDILLKDVRVPNGNMISRSNSAAPTRGGCVNSWFMLGLSAVYLGVAIAAHRAAIAYAKERIPTALGKPIAEVEGVQRRLGEAELLLRQARVLLYQAADMWSHYPDQRQEMTASIATAKYTATNNAIAAVDHCMRVAGGASMMKALPLERYYRDVRGGLSHPMNDDLALVTLGKLAIEQLRE